MRPKLKGKTPAPLKAPGPNRIALPTRKEGGSPVAQNENKVTTVWAAQQRALLQLPADKAKRAEEVVLALARLWPKCFFVSESLRRPLMTGMREVLLDLMAPAIKAGRISADDLTTALQLYTGCDGYLKHCTIINNARLNLNGEVKGTVEAKHAHRARAILAAGRA
jgi:hypothetical protein